MTVEGGFSLIDTGKAIQDLNLCFLKYSEPSRRPILYFESLLTPGSKASVMTPSDSTREPVLRQHQEPRLLCVPDVHDRSRLHRRRRSQRGLLADPGKKNDGYLGTAESRRKVLGANHHKGISGMARRAREFRQQRTGRTALFANRLS